MALYDSCGTMVLGMKSRCRFAGAFHASDTCLKRTLYICRMLYHDIINKRHHKVRRSFEGVATAETPTQVSQLPGTRNDANGLEQNPEEGNSPQSHTSPARIGLLSLREAPGPPFAATARNGTKIRGAEMISWRIGSGQGLFLTCGAEKRRF